MNQQDLTAPVDRVKVSRREQFTRTYEMFQDETTAQDLTSYTFKADLISSRGKLLTLTEADGLERPTTNAVTVTLNTIRMGEFTPGEYSLLLLGLRIGETEHFVTVAMQVV